MLPAEWALGARHSAFEYHLLLAKDLEYLAPDNHAAMDEETVRVKRNARVVT